MNRYNHASLVLLEGGLPLPKEHISRPLFYLI